VGVPEWNANAVTGFRKVVATGACAAITDVVPRLLGRAPRKFRAFAEENVSVFTPTKEETMSQPNELSVKEHFNQLGQRLDREPARTAGVTGTWQFVLNGTDGGSFFVEIVDGKSRVGEGTSAAPGVTITMTSDDYVAMANKKISGAELFMSGRMRVKGDPMLGMKAESIFG
jgi:putative sterol carrier protein